MSFSLRLLQYMLNSRKSQIFCLAGKYIYEFQTYLGIFITYKTIYLILQRAESPIRHHHHKRKDIISKTLIIGFLFSFESFKKNSLIKPQLQVHFCNKCKKNEWLFSHFFENLKSESKKSVDLELIWIILSKVLVEQQNSVKQFP